MRAERALRRCRRLKGGRAGAPTTVLPGGTSLTTTEFAPIVAPAPTSIGPISFAPVPMLTFGPDPRALDVTGA